MIDWLWMIPVFLVGFWFGAGTGKRFSTGAATGVIGALLALFMLN